VPEGNGAERLDARQRHRSRPELRERAAGRRRAENRAASGKNQFRLIGVSEFNLPQHRDHTVIMKGLLIKATPVSRLNITSVTTVAPSCPPAP
jgi:hypothetical protein